MKTILVALSLGLSSFAMANAFNTSDLINNTINASLRVKQIDATLETLSEEMDKLKDEKTQLSGGAELSAEQFISILNQHSGDLVGGCQINVIPSQKAVNLTIRRADGLSVSVDFTMKKLKKGSYQAKGIVGSNKRLMLLQAKDMYDEVNDKETKMTLMLNENNTIKSFRVNTALKGKNFDSKDCE